jgi:nucleotide-binding universal stress UspA family protein
MSPPAPEAAGALGGLVVGFDGSPSSARAVRWAIAVARGTGSTLSLVYAHQTNSRLAEPLTEEEVTSPLRAVERSLGLLVREAGDAGVTAEALIREGAAAEVVLRLARERGAGGIVVGTRGLGGAAKVILGSVSSQIVARATVPVTVVP